MMKKLDFSRRGWARIVLLTILGTVCCMAAALVLDSYSFTTGKWSWGTNPLSNILIPLLVAPPFFILLLSRVRQLAVAHEELMVHATTDSLTSCLNRRAFTMIVEEYLARMVQPEAKVNAALMIIDVDHFKAVNDQFGHDMGDHALKLIAAAIRSQVRESDLVARMGGEEFGVFLPAVQMADATQIAERVRIGVLGLAFAPRGETYPLSVSIGGATLGDDSSFSELYRIADMRLYEAKAAGRNRINMTPPPPSLSAQFLN